MSIAELGTGRYGQLLTKLLGIPGQSPVTEVGGALDVGLTLESDRPEWGFLKGENLFGNGYIVNAQVGKYAAIRFRNPAASGVIAVISKIWVHLTPLVSPVQFNIYLSGLAPPALSGENPGNPCDSRRYPTTGPQSSVCQLSGDGGDPGLSGASTGVWYLTGSVTHLFDINYVVCPGGVVDLVAPTNQTAITGAFRWTERALAAPYENV